MQLLAACVFLAPLTFRAPFTASSPRLQFESEVEIFTSVANEGIRYKWTPYSQHFKPWFLRLINFHLTESAFLSCAFPFFIFMSALTYIYGTFYKTFFASFCCVNDEVPRRYDLKIKFSANFISRYVNVDLVRTCNIRVRRIYSSENSSVFVNNVVLDYQPNVLNYYWHL